MFNQRNLSQESGNDLCKVVLSLVQVELKVSSLRLEVKQSNGMKDELKTTLLKHFCKPDKHLSHPLAVTISKETSSSACPKDLPYNTEGRSEEQS